MSAFLREHFPELHRAGPDAPAGPGESQPPAATTRPAEVGPDGLTYADVSGEASAPANGADADTKKKRTLFKVDTQLLTGPNGVGLLREMLLHRFPPEPGLEAGSESDPEHEPEHEPAAESADGEYPLPRIRRAPIPGPHLGLAPSGDPAGGKRRVSRTAVRRDLSRLLKVYSLWVHAAAGRRRTLRDFARDCARLGADSAGQAMIYAWRLDPRTAGLGPAPGLAEADRRAAGTPAPAPAPAPAADGGPHAGFEYDQELAEWEAALNGPSPRVAGADAGGDGDGAGSAAAAAPLSLQQQVDLNRRRAASLMSLRLTDPGDPRVFASDYLAGLVEDSPAGRAAAPGSRGEPARVLAPDGALPNGGGGGPGAEQYPSDFDLEQAGLDGLFDDEPDLPDYDFDMEFM
ncbi:hypothetical protein H696_05721 [Fonticula alba]|uniref:Uncharacterized protein n=1 Tax=Fonticula alba TaxID=691883 RepID=A0A058Z0I1_FONAL|nr:hypothetical protein H696_05721 [Fonticula alba]KCV67779.1 hypothetical protein H696_05721 [Fonticula alba]|eukprot:XP_009497810.1 hypothetical protein H696_05721 [Fonticula alba]